MSTALGAALLDALDDDALEVLARRVASRLSSPGRPASPWLTVAEAAEYLRCKRQRIYDLVSQGRLECRKDGSRSLFRREWLDTYLEGS